jgi:serine protease Do
LNQDLAEQFGLKDSHGVLVGDVQKGAPGEKAGLKQADVIVELDGKPIDEAAAFRNAIAMKAPGSKVNLTVVRDGQRIPVAATLDKLPENGSVASVKESQKSSNPWGFSVQPLTAELAKKFGYSEDAGVVITEVAPSSPASAAGLEPGMLVQQVNRRKVTSADEFNDAVQQNKEAKTLLLLVSDGQNSRFLVLKSGE